MANKKHIDPVEHAKMLLDTNLRDIKNAVALNIIPANPTRTFAINERVVWGAHKESYIRKVCNNGLYYLVESIGVQRERDKLPVNEFHYIEWHDLLPYGKSSTTKFAKEEKYFLRLSNSHLDSLLSKVYAYHAGIDFDADYQRDHVWTLDDKIALIDSIFNNIDIGKFVFVQRSMGYDGKLYEIIDGKQRLTAICEFYEDRFQYNGYYYSQLSFEDKNKFLNHGITYGYLENPSKRAIFETFIKLNTCGKPMDIKHINKVKKLLDELG
jgi:hypothetical protein